MDFQIAQQMEPLVGDNVGRKDRLQSKAIAFVVQAEIDAEMPVPHVSPARVVATDVPHLQPVRVGVAKVQQHLRRRVPGQGDHRAHASPDRLPDAVRYALLAPKS